MRNAAVIAIALLGCDQGARKAAPSSAPVPRDAPPTGTIIGKVTHTMEGPGRAHTPEESFSTTTPMTCIVQVRDPWGNAFDVASPGEGGGYRAVVPIGKYTVSFEACAEVYCAGSDPHTQQVEVTANGVFEVSFDCVVYAK